VPRRRPNAEQAHAVRLRAAGDRAIRASMNLALLLLLPASAATDLTPPPSAARAVTTYDAIVATEQTPAVKDLVKPAVFVGDGAKSPVVGTASPGPIA
jgi:hypothetical protein